MSKIQKIHAREIISSGGTPSLEVLVDLDNGISGRASVPYGASAGSREAQVIFDNDKNRYKGKGMLNAVQNINTEIKSVLVGEEADDQRAIDTKMIQLDGTKIKQRLGANAILGVSLAVAHASANNHKLPLYQYIRKSLNLNIQEYKLPNPMMVVIEGGKHADNSTDLQEYMFAPIGAPTARENIRTGLEAYFKLKDVLKANGYSTNVGNEGAFAPDGINTNEKPLEMMMEAVKQAGFEPGKDVGFSIDAASTEIMKDGKYDLKIENRMLSSDEMIAYFETWLKKYPILTMEDMLGEDDWTNWPLLNAMCQSHNCSCVGDDLTVTNTEFLQKAIDTKAISSILIKLNQIGSLTETVDTCMLARKYGMMTIPSHRGGGETNDTSLVDLAVAVNSGFIKVGPTRGERVCKYNRLMEIEQELGDKATPMGQDYAKIF